MCGDVYGSIHGLMESSVKGIWFKDTTWKEQNVNVIRVFVIYCSLSTNIVDLPLSSLVWQHATARLFVAGRYMEGVPLLINNYCLFNTIPTYNIGLVCVAFYGINIEISAYDLQMCTPIPILWIIISTYWVEYYCKTFTYLPIKYLNVVAVHLEILREVKSVNPMIILIDQKLGIPTSTAPVVHNIIVW